MQDYQVQGYGLQILATPHILLLMWITVTNRIYFRSWNTCNSAMLLVLRSRTWLKQWRYKNMYNDDMKGTSWLDVVAIPEGPCEP